MKYTLESGKEVSIPDKDIESYMEKLELTKEDAIFLWLSDNDLESDEELEELDAKAKKVKINHGAGENTRKKSEKPKTVKISDEKQSLFSELRDFLTENHENVVILKENKLFSLQIGGKTFKIDIIEQRSPKKS